MIIANLCYVVAYILVIKYDRQGIYIACHIILLIN